MDLVHAITNAINDRKKDERRNYIGASSIGRQCMRSIWYDYRHPELAEIAPSLQISFDIGKSLESLLLSYIEDAGIKVERACEANNYLMSHDSVIRKLQGHPDAILHLNETTSCVAEIKTANNSSFNKFKNHGLRSWSESYYIQLQAYMGMRGYDHGVLLALNKDTSEMHHEWVYFNEDEYQEIRARADAIENAEQEPQRINSSPLYFVCNMCKYKKKCHATKD